LGLPVLLLSVARIALLADPVPKAARIIKKERSGLQSACDELIDKGAIITGE
jgi:hypothetical protein